MASVLTHNMNDIKKVTFFIEEARKQGVQVLGPDVNESIYKFNVNQEGAIRFGLGAIKGTGESAVEAILEEREKNGPYQDIFDFASRVNLRAVNKKTFESMAQAGAFDSFEKYHRAQYLELAEGETQNLIEKAVRFGNNHQAEAKCRPAIVIWRWCGRGRAAAQSTGSSALDAHRKTAPRKRSGRLLYFGPPAGPVQSGD